MRVERRVGCGTVSFLVLLAVSLLLNLIFWNALQMKKGTSPDMKPPEFPEEYVAGDPDRDQKIVLIRLQGLIAREEPGQFSDSMIEDITLQLRQARDDRRVKAILLAINSPGGEVDASDVLYHELERVRRVKPIVVYMESVAASGGYYAAMGASYLMANDLSLTGSIGVILQTFNVKDLLDKIGVKALTLKSGKMKDILNPTREMTPEEQAYVQGLINASYDRFVGIVSQERHLDLEQLKVRWADGRILSGAMALQAKLIDELGYFEDAVDKCKELGKVKTARVVRYAPPFRLSALVRGLFGSEARAKSLLSSDRLPLISGRLYYLAPTVFGSGGFLP
ncbi:signal peptide peptidase SppA [Methylacidimicrobium sp. B4]|uniref:signal peptide peptidase SppA n=1 Tax=Methylacidimicrobium sp. B4 TaxID=2796139 RepID=UPI001A8E3117|nr:signal peptide peptidase SppA [Methylacidimicrobium sp. B4]QSR84133.1 signal peptide peptidase SppA [Methylacidimicrobium sp. B4]